MMSVDKKEKYKRVPIKTKRYVRRCCVCGRFLKSLVGENFGITVLVGTEIKNAHIRCAEKNNLYWFNM